MEVDLIWFDSMGAKSTCTKAVTRDTSILIDPGAAAMQPSYPMSDEKKNEYRNRERRKIQEEGNDADHIIISHYHYDHHFMPDFAHLDFEKLFRGVNLWIKDPNRWINYSHWAKIELTRQLSLRSSSPIRRMNLEMG
ncbi:hypothetical protein AKJ61_01875 [candidate division MSBL1 archaeon SCGC-AAA259B11]|uniref:Metallo-beta-lactamase domain-containing protein n=1 Tax=candidate division MSBL1 archaeon SCGC-AAA259B11 TaxID=1698260 RepID=A0A133U6T6_9EURY|nr:hypothetical protein AKJ61_01875 [candidate division MSBL1 archaeon SCGC-AAA259B11]